ncbi:MAG: SpoIIE family protein phosphatase [Bacteroidales bacterium]
MMNEVFLEIGVKQNNKHGNLSCGDTFLSKKVKEENRLVAVLSDGLGSGVKANVLSTMTASMAINFILKDQPIERTARSIMETLPVDSIRNISYSTFSIVDISYDRETRIIEYDNPSFIIVRKERIFLPPSKKTVIAYGGMERTLLSSTFQAQKGDRIIILSDGVTQSGMGNKNLPFGWGAADLKAFILEKIQKKPGISASLLAKSIVNQSRLNDILEPRDDTSCAVIYFRNPRKLLLCTGPPYNEEKDKHLGEIVRNYPGKKIISGGTTAQILARELNTEIHVGLQMDKSGLPPISFMDGVDLVTEGILTLSKIGELLKGPPDQEYDRDSPAGQIFQLLMQNDIIDVVVGTKINNAHQDPNLPVELEIRRNLMKKIVFFLEEHHMKEVNIEFI